MLAAALLVILAACPEPPRDVVLRPPRPTLAQRVGSAIVDLAGALRWVKNRGREGKAPHNPPVPAATSAAGESVVQRGNRSGIRNRSAEGGSSRPERRPWAGPGGAAGTEER